MKKKGTHKELKQKIKKLRKTAVTYKQVKKDLKTSLDKRGNTKEQPSEPEMAVEVLEKEDTAEQPVEKALIAEHIFRKAIEDSTPSGISGFDMQGRQIYVNRVFCEMVGWSEQDLLGAIYPFKYWPPEEEENVADSFQSLLRGEVPADGIELPFRRKKGDRFWGLVLSTALTDSAGKKIGQLMSVADISARKRAEEALRDLTSRLINAQETERKIVSQDLHDSIGGKLTGIKYSLEKIIFDLKNIPDSVEFSLNEVLSIVQSTIEETQRITKHLHPSILDDLGLLTAMRGICREFKEVYSHIQVTSDFQIQEHDVPESLKILIFRILQEALNNVAKHSRADTVHLNLKKNNQKIVLTVEDNGTGFDLRQGPPANSHERGLGLQSMRERTELFGGSFNIRSQRGKGTTICADWPCR